MAYGKTLFDYLSEYSITHPDKNLLGSSTGWLTVRQTLERTERTAAALQAGGLRAGSWVALRMCQCPEAVIMLLALQAVGAVAVLTGAHGTVAEALRQVAGEREISCTLSDESGEWQLTVCKTGVCIPLPDGQFSFRRPEVDPCAPGIVIFTSGSTGKSKAVILSQNNLISNLLASAPLGGYAEDDIALGALPLHHVFGLALLTGAIVLRHGLYLTQGANLDELLRSIQEQRVTRMNGVPSLYLNLAAHRGEYDLSSLRVGFIGGGPCTYEQFVAIEKELDMILVPVYGMSECVGISCGCHTDPQRVRAAGVGRIYPTNRCRIVKEDGSLAAGGETGEICVNGSQRMIGYCDPAETKAVIDAEGFLHTGDLGMIDENGVLHLNGRKKDIIIRNGINLSPRRIEEALLSIPGVEEVAVVGLPHRVEGEVPWAMVRTQRTKLELFANLSRLLHKNEIPVDIRIVDVIPHTTSGKPDKIKIKELLDQWAKV